MEHESETQDRKRDKKGGALFPWMSRAGSPTIPTGIDWTSPLSVLRSFGTILAHAPQGTLLRFALGAAVGVHGLILGASVMSNKQSEDARGEIEFLSRVHARDAAASALGGRTPMDALITGGKVLFGGPSTADAVADGEGADGEGADGEDADGEGIDDEGADGEGIDDEGADGSASADTDGALKAALEAANAGGGVGKPRLNVLSTKFGGSGTSAKLNAWPGSGGSNGAGNGDGRGKSARSKTQVRTNSGRMAKRAVRNRGALKQLGFAKKQSRRGRGSSSNKTAYEAASNAFEGQTGGSGGAPIGGAGAGVGGADAGATPSDLSGGTVNDKNISGREYCLPGRFLDDNGECQRLSGSNKSPWQAALGRAKWSLIGAGIAFFTALLLWKVILPKVLVANPPAAPFVKAAAIAAAVIGAGLLIHAFVVANQIEDKYGQSFQRDSIIDQGLQRSAQGKMLDNGPSQLQGADKMGNHGGPNGNFGFDR